MAKRAAPVFQFRPHPWHGLDVGPEPLGVVNAYIEIYERDHALNVVMAAMADYEAAFPV